MSRLATRAELDKLGRTLDLDPAALGFLADVPAEQLRGLRVAVYELLFADDRVLFARLAWLACRLPAGMGAALGQRVLGPMLTARVAAEMPARRAAEIGVRMPIPFWADVCVHLDPRRTRDLIRQLPPQLVVDVARELVERRDFMTMSRFVDFLPDTTAQAVVEAIEDEGALLRVAFYMGSKNRIDHLFRMLPRERLQALLLQVEDESRDLLPSFLSLLIHVSYGLKRELGDLAAAQGHAVLAGYVRATQEQGMWADLLPVVAAMSQDARRTVVNLPILREPAVQESILRAADEHSFWGLVLPLVELMDEANRVLVADVLAARPPAALEHAAHAALMGEHWEPLLDLVRRMPLERQRELGRVVGTFGEVDPDLVRRISHRAEAHGFAVSG